MSKVVKVIEVLAESENSWEDAAKAALAEASKRCAIFGHSMSRISLRRSTTERLRPTESTQKFRLIWSRLAPVNARSGGAAAVRGQPSTVPASLRIDRG